MRRIARVVAQGYPHHITQRGNRRQQVFFCDEDYLAYLDLLAEWCGQNEVDVWTYKVGGYQVCEKWLKDRRERRLSIGDIQTYCRVVTALGFTIALQRDINALYPLVEKATLTIE